MPKIAGMAKGTRVTSAPVAKDTGSYPASVNITGTRNLTAPAPKSGNEPPSRAGMKPKTRPTTGETATGKGAY